MLVPLHAHTLGLLIGPQHFSASYSFKSPPPAPFTLAPSPPSFSCSFSLPPFLYLALSYRLPLGVGLIKKINNNNWLIKCAAMRSMKQKEKPPTKSITSVWEQISPYTWYSKEYLFILAESLMDLSPFFSLYNYPISRQLFVHCVHSLPLIAVISIQ